MSDWTQNEELEFEVNGKLYRIDVEVKFVTDPNYGADADGNRGMSMTFLDDWKVLAAEDEDGNVLDVKNLPAEVEAKLEKEVEKIEAKDDDDGSDCDDREEDE